jgi:hypothetical protein
MGEKELEVGILTHTYGENIMIEIPGNVLLNIMYFCDVVRKETVRHAVPYVYPKTTELVKDSEGNLVEADIEWEEYPPNMIAFLKNIEKPIPVASQAGMMSEQIYHAFHEMHKSNIKKGLAKPIEEDNEQVSQFLAKKNKGRK